MNKMLLTPWTGTLVAEGRVSYEESTQAWNTIRLNKSILNEFPTLKNKRAKVSFKIECPRTIENLKNKMQEIEKENEGTPMLLYIYLDEPLE
jgi:hypothetical protein